MSKQRKNKITGPALKQHKTYSTAEEIRYQTYLREYEKTAKKTKMYEEGPYDLATFKDEYERIDKYFKYEGKSKTTMEVLHEMVNNQRVYTEKQVRGMQNARQAIASGSMSAEEREAIYNMDDEEFWAYLHTKYTRDELNELLSPQEELVG